MNVLLYTDADVYAGTERHMLDLALGLQQLGAGVTIACPRPGELAARADVAHVPVLALPKRGRLDRHAVRTLAEQLQTGQADIVHAHNGRTHIIAAAAVRRAGRGACVATQHFLAPARTARRGPAAWIAALLHRRAQSSTAHTIAISDAVRQAALARGEVAPAKITTVLNGSSPPDLSQAPTLARADLGLQADTPFIFCAARLQVEKDIPTLLAAMPQVLARHPAACCLIAGEGAQRPQLERQIAALALGGHVKLLGFRNDVPALLQACDLFVLPSTAEGFGLVLLEAMALSRPVIATRVGGPPEIVAHGQTGLLVPPGNPAALADAIGELLADPEQCRAFGVAGRQRYLQHFTIDRMARDVLAVYQKLSAD